MAKKIKRSDLRKIKDPQKFIEAVEAFERQGGKIDWVAAYDEAVRQGLLPPLKRDMH
jgi:hypothetical protein